MNLIKSKERVSKHGEVFTPKHIVDSMIMLIPDSSWSDKTQITLEPTCGNGNFIVEIVKKKISCGLTLYEALNTTFGMDIMEDNISECHERLYEICKEDSNILIYMAIIINNIFVVDDSLNYMKDGYWCAKKFYEKDPTNIEKEMVLSTEEQSKIKTLAKEFLKTNAKN